MYLCEVGTSGKRAVPAKPCRPYAGARDRSESSKLDSSSAKEIQASLGCAPDAKISIFQSKLIEQTYKLVKTIYLLQLQCYTGICHSM